MLILYITYVDITSGTSGSAVRPQKMYRAFIEAGHEVKLLSGSQQRWDRKARTAAVREIRQWLEENRPDICYIRISFDSDHVSLRYRADPGDPPHGYSHRVFLPGFLLEIPELYPRRTDFTGRLKDRWLDHLQRRTDNVLRCADIVYFPSEECKKYFSYTDMRSLPPAGEDHLSERCPEEKTCIYVGGLDGGYGVGMLLEALEQLNAGDRTYRLILVCREAEWAAFQSPYRDAPWLEVHHTSGDGLEPLYARAAVSVIPVCPTPYTHLAVNVKLFDYLSYGLPVVVTNARTISAIVRENGIGLVVPYEAEALANALQSIMDNPGKRKEYEKQCIEALRNGNLWVHRARQIVSDLEEK